MPTETEERDAQWYRSRLPEIDELLDLLGDDPAATLLGTAKTRAVADPTITVATTTDDPEALALVARAAEVIRRLADAGPHAVPSPADRDVLDAVVLIVARPALFVRDHEVLQVPPNWPQLTSDRALLRPNLTGIGCVVRGDTVGGTGALVASTHAITNNHVVCWLLGRHLGTWLFDPAGFAEAVAAFNATIAASPELAPEMDFLREHGSPTRRRVRIAAIAGTHPEVDIAVLRLAEPVAGARVVPLQASAPASLADRPVYVVGFPVVDSARATPLFVLERVFGATATLATKRVSPGYLRGQPSPFVVVHDASTLNGSSGSAVFDFETHQLIALHAAGSYYDRKNHAVPMWTLASHALMTGNDIAFAEA